MGDLSIRMAFRVVLGLAILGVAQANWVSRADAAITGKLYGVAFPDGGTSEGVVVGASGVNLRTTDQGTSWTSGTALATGEDLNAVAFPSATIGYTVGADGFIYSTTDSGTSWIENLNSGAKWTTKELKGVGFASTSVGCACGSETIICTSDGTTATGATWITATGLETFAGVVNAVAMPSTTVGFAGGNAGALFKGTLATDGSSTWASYTWPSGTDADTFYGIAATSVQLVCAVGLSAAGGTLIYVTINGGTTWVAPTTTIPVSTGLFAVAFHSQSTATGFKGFAVGKAGVVLTTVDAISATMTWLKDTGSPITSSDLYALSFPNQYEAYAVGKSGAIMHYDVTAHPTNSPSNAPTNAPTNSPSNAPTTHAPTHSGDTYAPSTHPPTHPGDTYAPTAALGDSSSSSGMSRGGIAAIIIACIILLVVILAVIYYFCIYNKKQPGDETVQTASPVDVPPEMPVMGSPDAPNPYANSKADTDNWKTQAPSAPAQAPASPKSPASGLSSVHNAIHNAASRRGAVPNSPGSPPESADPDAVKVDFTIQG